MLYKNKTKHSYEIQHATGGTSLITFKTYQQGRATWQGEKLHICHLDEEPPMDIFVEASMRLMSTSENHRGLMIVSATCLYFSKFVPVFTEEVVEIDAMRKMAASLKRKTNPAQGGRNKERARVLNGWLGRRAAHPLRNALTLYLKCHRMSWRLGQRVFRRLVLAWSTQSLSR